MSSSVDFSRITADLRANVTVKTRSYHLQKFEKCFVGSEAVDALFTKLGVVTSRADAVEIGGLMLAQGRFKHVTGDQDFKDGKLFYRFAEDEKNHGYNPEVSEQTGTDSWLSDYILLVCCSFLGMYVCWSFCDRAFYLHVPRLLHLCNISAISHIKRCCVLLLPPSIHTR
jgi:hypothetical protein